MQVQNIVVSQLGRCRKFVVLPLWRGESGAMHCGLGDPGDALPAVELTRDFSFGNSIEARLGKGLCSVVTGRIWVNRKSGGAKIGWK
jgi:hypothetical protein